MRKAILAAAAPAAAAAVLLAAGPASASVGTNGNFINSINSTVKINRSSGNTAAKTTETLTCDPNDWYYGQGYNPSMSVSLTENVNGIAQTYWSNERAADPTNAFYCSGGPVTFSTAVFAGSGQPVIHTGKGTLFVYMDGYDANGNWFSYRLKKSVTIK